MGDFVKRRAGKQGSDSQGGAAIDDKFQGRFPALYDHLVSTRYPDGEARETTTVLVFCEAGTFKACVHDRDNGLQCFLASNSWDGLWKAVEAVLVEGKGDWRPKVGKRK